MGTPTKDGPKIGGAAAMVVGWSPGPPSLPASVVVVLPPALASLVVVSSFYSGCSVIGYREAGWGQIRAILRHVPIDADAVIGKLDGWPLRQHLAGLAAFFLGLADGPWWEATPKQRAEGLDDLLKEIHALRRRLYRPYGVGGALLGLPPQQVRAALLVLEPLETEAQELSDALANAPSRSRDNARKFWRDAYWRALIKLLEQISSGRRLPQKLQIDFIHTCSPEPFRASKKRIGNFVSEHNEARPR
jgi:hypothetical protein